MTEHRHTDAFCGARFTLSDLLTRLWAGTVERAGRLPEPARHERVDGEWSFAETLRHLVFATDSWAGRMILGEPDPFHPIGLICTDFDPADAAPTSIDLDARPSYDEVLAVRAERVALVHRLVDELTDDGLDRVCDGSPWPGDPTSRVRSAPAASPSATWRCWRRADVPGRAQRSNGTPWLSSHDRTTMVFRSTGNRPIAHTRVRFLV